MGVDQVDNPGGRAGARVEKETESMMVEMGSKLKSMVVTLLDSDLKKGKVEEGMRKFLSATEEWLMGSKISQGYDSVMAEIDTDEWRGFLEKKCGQLSFPLSRVGGGTKRLYIQRVREEEGVMMWLADPGIQDGFGGVDAGFDDVCSQIFANDDRVIMERNACTNHWSFRLKADSEAVDDGMNLG